MKKHLPYALVIATLIAGFFGGMKYQQTKSSTMRAFNGQNLTAEQRQQFRGNGALAGNRGSGAATGEILSKDDKSITVKLRDGGSKIIFYSDKTSIGKTTAGAAADLEIGKQVVANGATNSDGSVTAENIQIRPSL